MTRNEFMRELERLLWDVSREEKEEALKYYEGYFDDAGPENEETVIKELGSPKRIASIIKKDLQQGNRSYDEGEYTEHGYRDGTEYQYEVTSEGDSGREGKGRFSSDTTKIALIVLLCIVLSPFLTGMFGVALGLLGTLFGLFMACAALALGFSVGGVVAMVYGFGKLFFSLPIGVLSIGVGFLMLGFGVLMIAVNIWLWGKLLPSLIRWIVDKANQLLHRKEERP